MGWSMVVHGLGPLGGPWTPVHVLYTSMRKGGAQKMLNEYFDRECEWI